MLKKSVIFHFKTVSSHIYNEQKFYITTSSCTCILSSWYFRDIWIARQKVQKTSTQVGCQNEKCSGVIICCHGDRRKQGDNVSPWIQCFKEEEVAQGEKEDIYDKYYGTQLHSQEERGQTFWCCWLPPANTTVLTGVGIHTSRPQDFICSPLQISFFLLSYCL